MLYNSFMPERPISRRESRQKEREEQKARAKSRKSSPFKDLMRRAALPAVLLFASIGGGVYYLSHQAQTPPTIAQPQSLTEKLRGFDRAMAQNPDQVEVIVPHIAQLSADYFCQQISAPCDPDALTKDIIILEPNAYVEFSKKEQGCKGTKGIPVSLGYSSPSRNIISLNNEFLFYRDRSKSQRWANPSFVISHTLIHEYHHVNPPIKKTSNKIKRTDPATNQQFLIDFEKGMLSYIIDSKDAKPGLTCYKSIRMQVEESVVEDSTLRMLDSLGLDPQFLSYEDWVTTYRNNVLSPYFQGDNSILLNYQQNSDIEGFFSELGIKLGDRNPKTQALTGEGYLSKLYAGKTRRN